MSDTQNSSSHGKLIAAVVAAALVVVLALISAFVWPGWALNKNGQAGQAGQTSQQASTSNGTDGDKTEPTKPSIDAVALPDGASELLKAMPDSVLNYARTKADASTTWSSTSPVEEYALTQDDRRLQRQSRSGRRYQGRCRVAQRYGGFLCHRREERRPAFLPAVPPVTSTESSRWRIAAG